MKREEKEKKEIQTKSRRKTNTRAYLSQKTGTKGKQTIRRRKTNTRAYLSQKTGTKEAKMADKIPYGRGIDAVGLPTGELGGAAGEAFESGEAFDLPGVFDKVKDWLVNNDDKIIRVVAPWLRKQLRNVSGVEALELPDSMSITKLVLPSQVARLSPAVKKLTKGDLIALGGWGVPRKLPEVLGLTAKDIQTIRDVFTPQMTSIASFSEEPEAWDVGISCCSCTPCCCAAAVTRPVRPVA